MTHAILTGLAPQEEKQPTLMILLQRLWPQASPTILQEHLEQGHVFVDERPRRKGTYEPDPGTPIRLHVQTKTGHYGMPEVAELARGNDWIIVDKPIGMPGTLNPDDPMDPILFMADLSGLERDHFMPIWPMPDHAGGPWPIITTTDAALMRVEVATQPGITWAVVTPRVAIPRGEFTDAHGSKYRYNGVRMTKTLSELYIEVFPSETHTADPVGALLDALAAEGYPVLGDRQREGYIVEGGLRLRLTALLNDTHNLQHSWNPPKGWWPKDAIAPDLDVPQAPTQDKGPQQAPQHANIRPFQVSAKTLEVLQSGHMWALDDRQTANRKDLAPGTVVQLQDPHGKRGPFALIEGDGQIAARVWSNELHEAMDLRQCVTQRLNEAIIHRAKLFEDSANTNLFRIIHAEADGLPGFYLDRIGSLLRATITSHAARAFKTRIYSSLMDASPQSAILEIAHLEDVRANKGHSKTALPTARTVSMKYGFLEHQTRVIGLEDNLRYWCEPWEGIDTGFFADQRENRRTLVNIARPKQKWLNLFGHTGAFSVALANQGAHVVNVDVSKRYLQWTEDNFKLNALDLSLNDSQAMDARAYLEGCDTHFDGIIVDPPTAAQTQNGFWSIRKDFMDLLIACFEHLAPHGTMLVCRNDRKRTQSLDDLIEAAAKAASWRIDSTENAPPASDYPTVDGFPESTRFEGRIVRGR